MMGATTSHRQCLDVPENIRFMLMLAEIIGLPLSVMMADETLLFFIVSVQPV